jgi:hypothetical protein
MSEGLYWIQNATCDYFHHLENCKRLSKNILYMLSSQNKNSTFPIAKSYHLGYTDLNRCILFKEFNERLKKSNITIKFNNKIYNNSYTLSYDLEKKQVSINN